MRILFAGTPEFARVALTALHAAGHTVLAVLTQPDRPAGRGMKLMPSAVKQAALRLGLPVLQPPSLKFVDIQATLRGFDADVMVVAAYGLILPQAVLDLPHRGCLNIHASLLPRWRGAAPIHRAILAGDSETGISIMQMDAGLDTGAVLSMDRLSILPDDTTGSLHDRLAALGGRAIVSALLQLDTLHAAPQAETGVTYAAKISKAEAVLDFSRDAVELARAVRAFNPVPGAVTQINGAALKIWRAHATADIGTVGALLRADASGLLVGCGNGALCLTEIQPAGGKRLSASQFIAGHSVTPDTRFGA